MRKITQQEFDNFEIDEFGYKICPSGDYSLIEHFGKSCSFGKRCSFGEWCSFGKRCSFGEWCSFGKRCKVENGYTLLDFLKFEGFGSEKRCTYFFLTDQGIFIRCGCFSGFIEDFINRVRETHGENKHGREYLMLADIAKTHFKMEE